MKRINNTCYKYRIYREVLQYGSKVTKLRWKPKYVGKMRKFFLENEKNNDIIVIEFELTCRGMRWISEEKKCYYI